MRAGRLARLASATLATATLATTCPSAARDRAYLVGGEGWRLERFGSNVAILRTGVTRVQPSSASSAGAGSMLLSCEGEERRLRLTLPERLPELGDATVGRALVRAAPAGADGDAVPARLVLDGERLSVSDTGPARLAGSGPGDVVLRIARLLGARPAGLEWLVAPGPGPIAPGRLVPVILVLAFAPGESVVLDDFLSSCRPAGR